MNTCTIYYSLRRQTNLFLRETVLRYRAYDGGFVSPVLIGRYTTPQPAALTLAALCCGEGVAQYKTVENRGRIDIVKYRAVFSKGKKNERNSRIRRELVGYWMGFHGSDLLGTGRVGPGLLISSQVEPGH